MAQNQGPCPQGVLPTIRSGQVPMRRGLGRRCGRFPLTQPSSYIAQGLRRSLQRGSAGSQSRTRMREEAEETGWELPPKVTRSGRCRPILREPGLGQRFLGLQPPTRSVPRSQVPGPSEVNRVFPGEPGVLREPDSGPGCPPPTARGPRSAGGRRRERLTKGQGLGRRRGPRRAVQRQGRGGPGQVGASPGSAPAPPRPRRGLWDQMMDRPPGRSPRASRPQSSSRQGAPGLRKGRGGGEASGGAGPRGVAALPANERREPSR